MIADASSVSPSSERIKELWVVYGLYSELWSYAIDGRGRMVTVKNKNKLVE